MAYSLRTFGRNEINLLCGGLHYLEPEDYPGAVELLAEAGCTEVDTARMYLEKTAEGKLGAARRELPQEVVDSMTIDTKVKPPPHTHTPATTPPRHHPHGWGPHVTHRRARERATTPPPARLGTPRHTGNAW
eukprot:COSAG04_NODE_132_length_24268_cov_7.633426_6_plen_132_part_00